MTTGVFAMVLGAAVLHATWNALVKVQADRLVMIAIMMLSQVAVAVMVIPFVALPTAESWPYIWASTALNTAYGIFLIKAYRYGDPSHVYPISRGSAPLISIVIWAMTQAPTALVSAVRETSMVFAVLIGVFALKERLDLARLVATGVTLIGTAMLKMSR